MNHLGTQYIETDRLILRRFERSDAQAMFDNWASVLKENGPQPIGSIDVCHWREGGDIPELGYCIGKRWWHQGVMTEALGAVIDFLFGQVGVQRIVARHDTNNPHSGGVMRKCGMRFEGIREKLDQNNQGVCNVACYAIEASDR